MHAIISGIAISAYADIVPALCMKESAKKTAAPMNHAGMKFRSSTFSAHMMGITMMKTARGSAQYPSIYLPKKPFRVKIAIEAIIPHA